MALRKDLDYYITRLDYMKFLRIHVVTWVIFLALCLAIYPVYALLAPLAADFYTEQFLTQNHIVRPKVTRVAQYEVGQTRVIELANGQKILYALVSNKANPTVGFSPWVYTYQVLSATGEVLEQRLRNTEFLLPGEQTYVIVYTNNPQAQALRIQPDSQSSVPVPHDPDSPSFLQQPKVVQRQATIQENPDKESYRLFFLFKNEDQLEVVRLDFIYILRDRQNNIVGLSNSLLTGFRAGTEREVEILSQPKPKTPVDRLPTLETIIRVNYLDPKIVILR